MFKKIQSAITNFIFQKELSKTSQNREVVSFDNAKKIGLLYDATSDTDFEVIKQYVKQIRGQHKEVNALGFIDKKQLPQNRFPQFGLDFFTKKDMGLKMIPNTLAVSNFINEAYDIVINLTDNSIFPLCYIAGVCKAKFRVGRFNKQYVHCYDMMIETNTETDLRSFINSTEDYLRKLTP